jgi:20S proteasome subunit beta 6
VKEKSCIHCKFDLFYFKLFFRNDNIILSTGGFYGDSIQLCRLLNARLHKFRFDYRCDMTVDLCAEMLARNLYYKRFFPYYTQAVLCGIDEDGTYFVYYLYIVFLGKGAIYSYDPVGTIERVPCVAAGNGEPIVQAFIDGQIAQTHISKEADRQPMTLERAIGLVKDSLKLAAERETSVGDKIDLIIAQHGKKFERKSVLLRED